MTPAPRATRVAIGLGSNLGDRARYLEEAVVALAALPGTRLVARSRWHETEPVGGPPGQGPYLNGVVLLDTELEPRALLQELLALERRAGRVRGEPAAPRTLDLDLLIYGERELDTPELSVPHPRLEQRRFVLAPLCEVWPERRLPSGRSVAERLAELAGALRA